MGVPPRHRPRHRHGARRRGPQPTTDVDESWALLFELAFAAADLPMVNVHSARHWTASMTARANMPDDARTAIMGHTSIAMTNHYTHRDAASLAALLDRAIPDLHDGGDVVDAGMAGESL